MENNKIHLLISTNGGTVVDTQINFIQLSLEGGGIGIYAGHAPLIGALKAGTVKYRIDSQDYEATVSGGVVSVANNEVTILARTAEKQ